MVAGKDNFLSDRTGEPARRNGEKFILFKIFSFTMTTIKFVISVVNVYASFSGIPYLLTRFMKVFPSNV